MAGEPLLISEEFSLIIDTNADASTFAKKLCAYCTGFLSESDDSTSQEQGLADVFCLEMQIEDDPSPKGKTAHEKNPFYWLLADRFDDHGDLSPCSVWPSRNFGANQAGEYKRITPENCDDFEFPAPFSVGIFFDVKPQEAHIDIIKTRAKKFFEEVWLKLANQTVNIEGFRLITHRKYGEETAI